MRLAYRAHLAWSFQRGPPNFVTFNLGFILTYSIDLICLAFVVNGGRCQHNWRTSIVWHPKIFSCYLITYVENFIKIFERHI